MAFTTRRRKKTQQSRPLRGPSSYGCFAARLGFYHAMFPGGNNPSCWREFFSPRPRSLKLKWKRGFRRFLAKCKPAIAKQNETKRTLTSLRVAPTHLWNQPAGGITLIFRSLKRIKELQIITSLCFFVRIVWLSIWAVLRQHLGSQWFVWLMQYLYHD